MTLTEWFDPTNEYHIRAYMYAEEHGCLPEGFVPDSVEWDSMWQVKVIAKIAHTYIENMIGG